MKNDFPRVPYGSTVHGEEEIESVIEVLRNSTQMGPKVELFEKKIASLFEKKYGLMTNSGSSALYLAMEVANMPRESEVITPALTFSTTVASLVKNGFIPSFVDVKRNSYCIDVNKIEEKISKKTKGILAPDLLGNICEWDKIREIADKHDLLVFQDSADTLGASYKKKSTGSFSDLSITSFYGSHVINGAGNGGMLCTSEKTLYEKTKLLRSWGRSSSIFSDSESIENRFNVKLEGIRYDAKFVFDELGYQLEPSEISAAFALIQLEKLEHNISLRRKYFDKHMVFFREYEDLFDLPEKTEGSYSGWLAFPLIVKEGAPFNRTEFQIFLEERNIQTRVVFTGNILRQPGFKNINCIGKAEDFLVADEVMKGGVLLGCHHGLNNNQIAHLHEMVQTFIKNF
ncbi:MAG: NarL family transcriptional regulator [Actinobacteria bacterium]|nr:NarL family transcriptional regulator [Actinomycetota bacterium]